MRGPIVARSFEPRVDSATTHNYLHHKEEMIDGLEVLAINPYLNCMTLERRMREKRDEWTSLPWETRAFCMESIEEFVEKLEELGPVKKPLKLVAYIGKSLCENSFHKILFGKASCRG